MVETKWSLPALKDLHGESQILQEILNFDQFYPKYSQEINKNKNEILNLEDNWDDEGTKSYNKSTWLSVENFLKTVLVMANRLYHQVIEMPIVYPGENGSIDLHWKTVKFELLIKFYEEKERNVSYYGDNYKNDRIKGSTPGAKLSEIVLAWLSDIL